MRILLVNPPVVDTQFWAYWSMPQGLLRVATWLREQGCDLRLLDCVEPSERRTVRKKLTGLVDAGGVLKQQYWYGLTPSEIGTCVAQLVRERWIPDQVWVTSLMTYWWRTTAHVVKEIGNAFPGRPIRVGGIYPTLCPNHALRFLGLGEGAEVVSGSRVAAGYWASADHDLVVTGEIPPASDLPLAIHLYSDPVTSLNPHSTHRPQFYIVTSSRGCPFNCAYCAQRAINGKAVRTRRPDSVVAEMVEATSRYGIREFAFFEDNLLANRQHVLSLMGQLVDQKNRTGRLRLFAPEGVEPRLLNEEVACVLREAGFRKLHLGLETIDCAVKAAWNRSHATLEAFEEAVANCVSAGFKLRNQDINAFVLFGVPGERAESIIDTIIYASHTVGSIVPMLFTPVPGSELVAREPYHAMVCKIIGAPDTDLESGEKLELLNGKLHPFSRFGMSPAVDYMDLEALMFVLNTKLGGRTFDLLAATKVGSAFRSGLSLDARDSAAG